LVRHEIKPAAAGLSRASCAALATASQVRRDTSEARRNVIGLPAIPAARRFDVRRMDRLRTQHERIQACWLEQAGVTFESVKAVTSL
jgi:hypothetical protein